MSAVGWVGMSLLLASYALPLRFLLPVQFIASGWLLAYAVGIHALPFVVLNAVCFVLILVRLVRS